MKIRKSFFSRISSVLLALSMVLLMAGTMGTTALAAGNDMTGQPPGETKANRTAAVPVSQTENDINGRHILTKVFDVTPDTDPETLKEDGMTVGGYTYELISITKGAAESFEDTQTVSEPQTLPLTAKTSDDAYREAVVSFAPTIEYDKDGYKGTLYLDNASIEVSETGRTQQKGSDAVTKSYTLEYNDDDQVPATITHNGKTYNRMSISWADGEYGEDGVVPNNYIATVRYGRSYTYSTVDGYQATATYAGEVGFHSTNTIRYTVEYLGTPVSSNLQAMNGMSGVTGFYQDAQGNYQPVMGMAQPNQSAGLSGNILTAIIVLICVVFVLAIGVAILVTLMLSNNKKNQELARMRANNAPVMLLGPSSQASAPVAEQAEPVQADNQ